MQQDGFDDARDRSGRFFADCESFEETAVAQIGADSFDERCGADLAAMQVNDAFDDDEKADEADGEQEPDERSAVDEQRKIHGRSRGNGGVGGIGKKRV